MSEIHTFKRWNEMLLGVQRDKKIIKTIYQITYGIWLINSIYFLYQLSDKLQHIWYMLQYTLHMLLHMLHHPLFYIPSYIFYNLRYICCNLQRSLF